MIRLGIENNIYEKDDVLHFGNNCGMLKYTNWSQVERSGSWPIEGIAHYESIYRSIVREHENVDIMVDGSACDMWSFI